MTKPIVCFTVIAANYLAKARVLAKSVKRHSPSSKFILVLCDDVLPQETERVSSFDEVWSLQDLELPVESLMSWLFKHELVEACTAVKARAFQAIMDRHPDRNVLYFDPDIVVLDSLKGLEHSFKDSHVLLTPHQCEPDEDLDAISDNEICSLRFGVFNLGFLGVRASSEGRRFLDWWQKRLMNFCYNDVRRGLFTDQKWINFAPIFFEGVAILKDNRYNVATWNLSRRRITTDENGHLRVDRKRVCFFHFSGYDSGAHLAMLSKYAPPGSPLFEFRDWYQMCLIEEGERRVKVMPWAFSRFDNGTPVTGHQRLVYRHRLDLIRAFPNPFAVRDHEFSYLSWYRHEFPEQLEKRKPAPDLRVHP